MRTRRIPWLFVLGAASVGTSLLVRVVFRGPYYAGCELIAATVGQSLASTMSFVDALREAFYQNRHFWLPWPTYPVPFALIPGYLGRLWPWEYWAHVTTFLAVALTMLFVAKAADLGWRAAGIVLLGWGASPMLLSYAVVGEAWGSAFLPTAIALWVVMSTRSRERGVAWSLVWTLVAVELASHVYEAGLLVGVVFIAAALDPWRRVRPALRATWVVLGLYQLADALFLHPTANVKAFVFQDGSPWGAVAVTLGKLAEGVGTFVHAVVMLDLDLPVLLGLGLASFAVMKRDRMLLFVLLAVQVGLQVLICAFSPGNLRPRRFIMVDGYCLVCIACMYRDGTAMVRAAVASALILGNLWQGAVLRRFVQHPLDTASTVIPLPYMHSLDGVGLVDVPAVQVARELRTRVESGQRLLLLYNLGCYWENITNPAGVLERLYVSLGHERFVESVFVFGSEPCRYDCLPIRPLAEFEAFLDGLHRDGPTPPETLTGYYTTACGGPGMEGVEVQQMIARIKQRFRIAETAPASRSGLVRFTVEGPRVS